MEKPQYGSARFYAVGNGDVGVNIWVEPNGDILLYIGKSDAWDEYSRLLKLGRIRVRFLPSLLGDSPEFEQKLNFADGEVIIKFGEDPNSTLVRGKSLA